MTFQKGKFDICSIFLDTFRRVKIIKRRGKSTERKQKKKIKIKLSV